MKRILIATILSIPFALGALHSTASANPLSSTMMASEAEKTMMQWLLEKMLGAEEKPKDTTVNGVKVNRHGSSGSSIFSSPSSSTSRGVHGDMSQHKVGRSGSKFRNDTRSRNRSNGVRSRTIRR